MSQNPNTSNPNPQPGETNQAISGSSIADNAPKPAQAQTPVPTPAAAPGKPAADLAPVNDYVPGGLNQAIVNPVKNPHQTDNNFPFASGHKMHEVAQYQNFFTYPLDTSYNVYDAIFYFSDENNRNRYTYEQQQIIISRIVRAAIDFGIPIEGIRDKLMS